MGYLIAVIYAALFYVIFRGKTSAGEIGLYYPLACKVADGENIYAPARWQENNSVVLRGWLEVVPLGWLFRWFGKRLEVQHLYFYIGNVASLLVALRMAELRKPLSLWFVLLTAFFTTMPTCKWWGGWRVFWGHLAVLLALQGWGLFSGLCCGVGFFYSFDMGLLPLGACLAAGSQNNTFCGFVLVLLASCQHLPCYLRNILLNKANYALWPELDVHLVLRVAFGCMFFWLVFNPQWIVLWFYGLLLYLAAFRNLGGGQIFPALQVMCVLFYLKI